VTSEDFVVFSKMLKRGIERISCIGKIQWTSLNT
jgi:hypothetical protein